MSVKVIDETLLNSRVERVINLLHQWKSAAATGSRRLEDALNLSYAVRDVLYEDAMAELRASTIDYASVPAEWLCSLIEVPRGETNELTQAVLKRIQQTSSSTGGR